MIGETLSPFVYLFYELAPEQAFNEQREVLIHSHSLSHFIFHLILQIMVSLRCFEKNRSNVFLAPSKTRVFVH